MGALSDWRQVSASNRAAETASAWQPHESGARPVESHVLVKVRYEGETLAEAEDTAPLQAGAYEWADPEAPIKEWRRARLSDASLSQRVMAEVDPWIAGMASPFMQRFIFGALILAAATFVAMLAEANS